MLDSYPFHLGGRDRNDALKGGEFHKLFTPFYDVFGKLPLVISETSKSYNYEEKKYPTDPLPGTAIHMEAQSKVDWFSQMTCLATKKAFPNLLSVIWYVDQCCVVLFTRQFFRDLMLVSSDLSIQVRVPQG